MAKSRRESLKGAADVRDYGDAAGPLGRDAGVLTTRQGTRVSFKKVMPYRLADIAHNPNNTYNRLSDDQLSQLADSIKQAGLLSPLLIRKRQPGDPEGPEPYFLVCGENRHVALKDNLKWDTGDARLVDAPFPLTRQLERELMKWENALRRGGEWSRADKVEWIEKKFGKKVHATGKGSVNLAQEIEAESGGRIPAGTAKRLVAELRKTGDSARNSPEKPRLTETARKRRERDRLKARLDKLRAKIKDFARQTVATNAEIKKVEKALAKL